MPNKLQPFDFKKEIEILKIEQAKLEKGLLDLMLEKKKFTDDRIKGLDFIIQWCRS